MSNTGWREVILGDLIEIKYGKDHKKLKEGSIPCMGTGGVMRYVERAIYDKTSILLPRKGSLNNIYYINKPFWTVDTLFWSKINEKLSNPKFLFYVLSDVDLASLNVGSAVPSLTVPVLNDLPINLPPLPTQKAIAKILGDLDAKIELNRKMNESLEAMAQALFQSWFVDFDPVLDNFLAKNGGNVDALPEALRKKGGLRIAVAKKNTPEINELFPDSFLFNEVLEKWTPKGWGNSNVGESSTVIGGGTPSTKIDEYFCEEGISWLSPKDLSGYSWKFIGKGAKDITDLGLKKSSAKLMPAGTVLFSSRAPIGYIAIAENKVSTNQGFKSLIPDKGLPTEYLFQFLKQNADKIESVATGSTFKEVSGSALKSISIIVPSKKTLDELVRRTKDFNENLLVNQKQTQSLTKLRDTLLPQLISGKLSVPEAMLEVNKEIVS